MNAPQFKRWVGLRKEDWKTLTPFTRAALFSLAYLRDAWIAAELRSDKHAVEGAIVNLLEAPAMKAQTLPAQLVLAHRLTGAQALALLTAAGLYVEPEDREP